MVDQAAQSHCNVVFRPSTERRWSLRAAVLGALGTSLILGCGEPQSAAPDVAESQDTCPDPIMEEWLIQGSVTGVADSSVPIQLNVFETISRRCDASSGQVGSVPGLLVAVSRLQGALSFSLSVPADVTYQRPSLVVAAHSDPNWNGVCDAGEDWGSVELAPGNHDGVVIPLRASSCPGLQ
jgi:hypothetical protein